MVDGNGALYPVSRDCVGMVREPPALNLPVARALAAHALPLHPHAAAAAAQHPHHTALKSQVRPAFRSLSTYPHFQTNISAL